MMSLCMHVVAVVKSMVIWTLPFHFPENAAVKVKTFLQINVDILFMNAGSSIDSFIFLRIKH